MCAQCWAYISVKAGSWVCACVNTGGENDRWGDQMHVCLCDYSPKVSLLFLCVCSALQHTHTHTQVWFLTVRTQKITFIVVQAWKSVNQSALIFECSGCAGSDSICCHSCFHCRNCFSFTSWNPCSIWTSAGPLCTAARRLFFHEITWKSQQAVVYLTMQISTHMLASENIMLWCFLSLSLWWALLAAHLHFNRNVIL